MTDLIEYSPTDHSALQELTDSNNHTQSFTLGTTGSNIKYTITSVVLDKINVTGNTTGRYLTIELWDDSGVTPIYSSGSISAAAIDENNKTINMSPCVLEPSTTYRLALSYTNGDASNYLTTLLTTNYTGGVWADDTDYDLIFKVYGTPYTVGKINIGDSWKDISAYKINIGDSWKTVNSIKINIGDSWKTSF